MIYGLNWGAPTVPPEVRRLFKERLKLPGQPYGMSAYLVGACQTQQERDQMLYVSVRPGRSIHVVHLPRKGWYGLYEH